MPSKTVGLLIARLVGAAIQLRDERITQLFSRHRLLVSDEFAINDCVRMLVGERVDVGTGFGRRIDRIELHVGVANLAALRLRPT